MMPPPNFDRVARLYRPIEYLTFGPLLARTRLHFLPQIQHCRCALVFGDGDGRFLAHMLAQCPGVAADAVDRSPGMLTELLRRCASHGNRLSLHCTDAQRFEPQVAPDLVVTHFFLDCLTLNELGRFVPRISARMPQGALWLVSDFRIPLRGPSRLIARVLVRLLYLAFRILTGLRVSRLPDYAPIFEQSGLRRVAHCDRLFGILRTELWSRT